jgi:hypothetical protein
MTRLRHHRRPGGTRQSFHSDTSTRAGHLLHPRQLHQQPPASPGPRGRWPQTAIGAVQEAAPEATDRPEPLAPDMPQPCHPPSRETGRRWPHGGGSGRQHRARPTQPHPVAGEGGPATRSQIQLQGLDPAGSSHIAPEVGGGVGAMTAAARQPPGSATGTGHPSPNPAPPR